MQPHPRPTVTPKDSLRKQVYSLPLEVRIVFVKTPLWFPYKREMPLVTDLLICGTK